MFNEEPNPKFLEFSQATPEFYESDEALQQAFVGSMEKECQKLKVDCLLCEKRVLQLLLEECSPESLEENFLELLKAQINEMHNRIALYRDGAKLSYAHGSFNHGGRLSARTRQWKNNLKVLEEELALLENSPSQFFSESSFVPKTPGEIEKRLGEIQAILFGEADIQANKALTNLWSLKYDSGMSEQEIKLDKQFCAAKLEIFELHLASMKNRMLRIKLYKGVSLHYDFVVLEKMLSQKIAAIEDEQNIKINGSSNLLVQIVNDIVTVLGPDSRWQVAEAYKFIGLKEKLDELAAVLGEDECKPAYEKLDELRNLKGL